MLASCDTARADEPDQMSNTMSEELQITIGSHTFTASLADNATAQALMELLPLTITMNELNGNEKYHYLDSSLPTDTYRPGTIQAGDILLYGNNCIVLFYKTFSSSYSYTRIGRIDDPTGLQQALGTGNVSVRFAVDNSTTSLTNITTETTSTPAYTLTGQSAPDGYKGIVVQQCKKILKR